MLCSSASSAAQLANPESRASEAPLQGKLLNCWYGQQCMFVACLRCKIASSPGDVCQTARQLDACIVVIHSCIRHGLSQLCKHPYAFSPQENAVLSKVWSLILHATFGAGMLFGWETVMTFVLVSVVYAVAVGEPSFGNVGPYAVGLSLFSMVFAG